jgi:CheY-like chemotaxis protein
VGRIVIVEDDALVAKYLKYVLDQDGRYDVVVTESGDEVLAFARDPTTVALIVDVSLRSTQLGGRYVDGLELTRAVKADPAAARLPVIVATAHAMAGDRERFLRESGADGFLRKPITDPGEVRSLIAELAGRRTE